MSSPCRSRQHRRLSPPNAIGPGEVGYEFWKVSTSTITAIISAQLIDRDVDLSPSVSDCVADVEAREHINPSAPPDG